MAERKIAGWITAFGKHIPIYEDDPNIDSYEGIWKDESDKKEKQIQENKVQADTKKLQQKGYKGSYKLYRAGDLSGGPTGMVYLTPDENEASEYSKPSSFKMQGKTYRRPKREVSKYTVEIKNPLVASSAKDAISQATAAHKQLYPERKDFDNRTIKEYAKADGYKVTGVNSAQLYLDSMNAKALKQSNHDSIIYTDATKDGRVVEVIVLPTHKSLKKGN